MAAFLLSCAAFGQTVGNMTGTVLTQPCNNNGSIGVTVSNLTPPINYTYTNWMGGLTFVNSAVNSVTNSISGLPALQNSWMNANIWTIMASDGVNNAVMSLTLTPPFAFWDSVQVASCPALSTVQAGFSGGTSPYTCLWTNLNTLQTFTANPAAVPNGPYSLVATDGSSCMLSSATGSGNINVFSVSSIVVSIAGSPANCTNGTATVTASGGVGPYSYLWNNGATTQSISGLLLGMYTCTVTDSQGCQTAGSYFQQQTVNLNFNNTTTNATCLQNNGAVTGFVNGGTAPYTFLWSNGATTQNITGVAAGQYNVQITDANGCIGTGFANVAASTPVTVTYTASASSCTAATGGATITPAGGLAPYTVVWYTAPLGSGMSISSMPAGSYSFKVTDANGCIRTGVVLVPSVSSLNATMSNAVVTCPANTGNLSISVTGSNPPFTYLWSNGATTTVITGAGLNAYSCVVTDALGCTVTKYAAVSQISPINVGFSTTQASCVYNADGAITANATGGTAPYSYQWSNSQTLPTITGLATGNYYVSVTDANGCTNSYNNSMAYVGYNAANNSCYCTITGTVYIDANNNCVRNAGENGVANIGIHISGQGYAYTNSNGVYSKIVPSGTYTISESVQQIYPLSPCQSNNQVVSVTAGTNCATTVNFANNVVVLHDLRIFNTNINFPVPGNTYTQKVIVYNDGTIVENGIQLGYQHDGQLGFASTTPWVLTQPNSGTFPNWYRISSGFPALNPGTGSAAFMNYNVPSNIPMSTVINFNDTATWNAPMSASWLTDNTPWNNVASHQAVVVSSYDPNFKEVSPQGSGSQGNIQHRDSVLTYVVHFQNTGTYFAQNIVVIDSLDADLRIASMRPGYADHNYTVEMNENGVAKFTFKNINLPWKAAYGDAASSGMFTYSIKLKNNLPLGTQIRNTAAIYFDYNEPIITNTTLNTLFAPVSIHEMKGGAYNVSLYPNPANNYFTLSVSSPKASGAVLSVFDVSGRQVSAKTVELLAGENQLGETTAQLQSGIYFVKLESADLKVGKKLIIAK